MHHRPSSCECTDKRLESYPNLTEILQPERLNIDGAPQPPFFFLFFPSLVMVEYQLNTFLDFLRHIQGGSNFTLFFNKTLFYDFLQKFRKITKLEPMHTVNINIFTGINFQGFDKNLFRADLNLRILKYFNNIATLDKFSPCTYFPGF